jgi:hypothetical protein
MAGKSDEKSVKIGNVKDGLVEGDDVYCWDSCKLPSDMDMVGCEEEGCAREWFHLSCVGLDVAPEGPWICPDCHGTLKDKDAMDKEKGNVAGGGGKKPLKASTPRMSSIRKGVKAELDELEVQQLQVEKELKHLQLKMLQKKFAAEQAEEQIESVRSKVDLKGTNDITGGKKVAMKPEDGKPLSQLQSLTFKCHAMWEVLSPTVRVMTILVMKRSRRRRVRRKVVPIKRHLTRIGDRRNGHTYSALPAVAVRPGGGAMPAVLALVDGTGLSEAAVGAAALDALREALGMLTEM